MRRYYDFKDKETGEEFEKLMDSSEVDQYLEDNPNLSKVFKMPTINTVNSATFVDGHAPNSRKQAINVEKEIAQLKVIEAGTHPEKRDAIKEEIKKAEGKRKAPMGSNKGGERQ